MLMYDPIAEGLCLLPFESQVNKIIPRGAINDLTLAFQSRTTSNWLRMKTDRKIYREIDVKQDQKTINSFWLCSMWGFNFKSNQWPFSTRWRTWIPSSWNLLWDSNAAGKDFLKFLLSRAQNTFGNSHFWQCEIVIHSNSQTFSLSKFFCLFFLLRRFFDIILNCDSAINSDRELHIFEEGSKIWEIVSEVTRRRCRRRRSLDDRRQRRRWFGTKFN